MPRYDIEGFGLVDAPDNLTPQQVVASIRANASLGGQYKAFDDYSRRKSKGLPTIRDIESESTPDALEQFNRRQEAELAAGDQPSLIGRMTGGDDSFVKRAAAGAIDLIRAPFALRSGLRMGPHSIETLVAERISNYLEDIPSGLRMRPEVNTSKTIGGVVESAVDAIRNPSVASIGGAYADLGQFGLDAIAQNAPQLLLGGGVMGALTKLGASLGLAARLAPIITTFPQESSLALEQYAAAGKSGMAAKAAALAVGMLNAGLESLGDARLLKRMFPDGADPGTIPKSVWREVKNAFEQAGIESATEGAQKIATQAGEVALTGKLPDPARFGSELMTEMAAGGFVGGGMSAAVSGINAYDRAGQMRREDEAKDERLRQRANLIGSGLRLDQGAPSRDTGIRYTRPQAPPVETVPDIPVGELIAGPERRAMLDPFDTDAGVRSAQPQPEGVNLIDIVLRANARDASASGLTEAQPNSSGETTPIDQLLRRGQGARRRQSVLSGMEQTQEGGDRYGQVQEQGQEEEVVETPKFPPDPNQPPPPPIRKVVEEPRPSLLSEWEKERDSAGDQDVAAARQWLDVSVDIATGMDLWKTSPVFILDAPAGDPNAAMPDIREALTRIGVFGATKGKLKREPSRTGMVRPTPRQMPRGRIVMRDMETGDVVVVPAWINKSSARSQSLPEARAVSPDDGSVVEVPTLFKRSRTSRNTPRYVPMAVYPQLRERASSQVERFSGRDAQAIELALPEIVGQGRIIGRGRRKGDAGKGGGANSPQTLADQDAADLAKTIPSEQEATPDNRLRIAANRALEIQGIKPGDKLTPEQAMSVANIALEMVSGSRTTENKARYLLRWYPDVITEANKNAPKGRRPSESQAWQIIMRRLADEISAMHDAGTLGTPEAIEGSILYAPNEAAKLDAEYMAAVEAGDMTTAQRMVDEAAKRAGYTIGPVWHGTKGSRRGVFPFTVFRTDVRGKLSTEAAEETTGAYFSPNERYAKGVALYQTGMDRDGRAVVGRFYLRGDVVRQDRGAEGFKEIEYRATDPSQIKSAEPVTRDDAGNVIPLSKRFDRKSDSILYAQPSGQSTAQTSQPGPRDTESILYSIAPVSDQEARVIRAIAQKLGNATTYVMPDEEFDQNPNNRGRIAYYDPRNHRIVVRQSAGAAGQPFLHEAAHAATVRGLVTDPEFRAEVEKLQREARALLGVGTYGTQAGLSRTANLAEFVAEVFSNPDFRAQLDAAQAGKKKSILQRFIDALMKLFGIERRHRPILERMIEASQRSAVEGGSVMDLDPLATKYPKGASVSAALANPMAQTPEAQVAIEREASAQADLFEASADPYRQTLARLQGGSAHERATGRMFEAMARWIPDQANAMRDANRMATTPIATISGILSSMPESQREQAAKPYQQAAVEVLDLRHKIKVRRESNEAKIDKLRQRLDDFIQKKLPKQRGLALKSSYLQAASDTAVQRYDGYLKARQKTSPNLTQREQAVHMQAVNRLADVRDAIGGNANQLTKALDLIAGSLTMQELDAIQTLPDLEDLVFTRGILLGPEAQRQGIGRPVAEFLANQDGTGALQNMGNMLEVLKRLRGFQESAVQYDQDVDDFESWWRDVAHGSQGAGKSVPVAEFVRKIVQMDRQKRSAIDMMREMDREFDKLDREMRARIEYRNLIDTVLSSPQYNQTLDGAQQIAGAIGFIESGRKAQLFGTQDGSVIPYQEHVVGDQKFKIRWTLEENVEEENWREVGRMVEALHHEILKTDIDPVQREGYKVLLRNAENYFRVHGGTTASGATQTGSLDIINRITDVMPLVDLLKTRGDITRKLPGRIMLDLLRSQQAVNAVSLGLRGVANHPVHGSKRQAEDEAAAIKSHSGMTPEQWRREVLEPIFDEGQRFDRRNPEAGRKSRFGHAYTSQDLKAAKLQSQYVNHAMRVIQGPASRSGVVLANPVLVEDKEAAVARGGAAVGPITMPRGFNRGSNRDPHTVDYWDKAWREASEPTDDAAKRAARIALLVRDDSFFDNVAVAYVWEQNPEFAKIGLLRQAMDSLSVDWHDNPSTIPNTWDELVAAVTERHNEIQIQQATDENPANILDPDSIADAMLGAFDQVFGAYRAAVGAAKPIDQLGLTEKDLEGLANKDVLLSIMSAESSFTQPRGRMVAPSSFYRYGIATTGQKAGVLAAAMAPFRMRELALMEVALRAIKDRHDEMGRDIASVPVAEYTRRTKAGREYADYAQLGRLYAQLNRAVELYRGAIAGVSGSLQEDSFLDAFLSADRALLLASPTAALSNVLSAISLGSSIPSLLVGQTGRAFGQAARNIVTGIPRLIMSAVAGTQGGRYLRQHLRDLPWGVRHFASKLQQYADFHRIALENNIIAPRLPLSDQVKIARDVGSISFEAPVLGPGRDPNSWRRRISRFIASHPTISTPLLGLFQISQLGDELGNTLAYQSDDRNLRYYMAALYGIMQNRYDAHGGGAAGMAAVDPNDIRNKIRPEEFAGFSMANEDVRTAGQLFAAAGGIERAAFNYWNRARKASPEDRPNVPLFDSPNVEADVRRAVQMTTNLAADSNRPDALKNPRSLLGRALSTIFTFPGWTSGWFSTIGRLMQASTQRGPRYSASNMARSIKMAAILLVLLAMLGAETPELRNLITRFLMNREPTSVSLSTVLQDPSPENVLRGMATAIASTLPYAGEYLADAAGAPTYRASIGDITRMSRTFSMIGGLKDALEYGAKTGDYGGMASQTLRNMAPVGSMVWNRIPSIAERNAVADAVRAARVASGPLETTPQGGGSAGREPTQFSALIRMATAAEVAGDSPRASALLKQAEELKRREGVRNPRSAIMSALSTQAPDIKAFGRRLEESEKSALLGRMGKSARSSYLRVDDAVARLKGRTKAPARAKKPTGALRVRSIKTPKVRPLRPPGRGLRIGASRSVGTSRLRMGGPSRVGRVPGAGMPRASGLILG